MNNTVETAALRATLNSVNARLIAVTAELTRVRRVADELAKTLDSAASEFAAWRALPWWRRVWRAMRRRL